MNIPDVKKESLYMNIHTGNVDTGDEWLNDFEIEHKRDCELSWDEWNGGSLIEVTCVGNDFYKEVRS